MKIRWTYVVSLLIGLYSILGVIVDHLTSGAFGHDLNTAGKGFVIASGFYFSRRASSKNEQEIEDLKSQLGDASAPWVSK